MPERHGSTRGNTFCNQPRFWRAGRLILVVSFRSSWEGGEKIIKKHLRGSSERTLVPKQSCSPGVPRNHLEAASFVRTFSAGDSVF